MHTYHREESESYVEALHAAFFTRYNAACIAYALGKLFGRAAANSAATCSVRKLNSEAEWSCDFKNDFGKVCAVGYRGSAGQVVVAEIRREYADVSFAAEHYYLLVINGNTAEFLSLAVRNGCFKADAEVEAYVNCKVSAIESDVAY